MVQRHRRSLTTVNHSLALDVARAIVQGATDGSRSAATLPLRDESLRCAECTRGRERYERDGYKLARCNAGSGDLLRTTPQEVVRSITGWDAPFFAEYIN